MGDNGQSIQGILAFITTDKNRYLGGAPLSILANNREELVDFAETIAESFLAEILELKSGDYLIIKK